MPPRLNFSGARRSLAVRPRPLISWQPPIQVRAASRRGFADEKDPKATDDVDQGALGHVSEEAADVAAVTGQTKPDLEQGTPVQEILEREGTPSELVPQVIRDNTPDDKHKTTDLKHDTMDSQHAADNLVALEHLKREAVGQKFELPHLPIPSDHNLKYRYDSIVKQVTNLMMQHGKLAAAQRNMSYILNHLRTAPPPTVNPSRPLLPGSPPPSHLPLNPVTYLTVAIDSVAPLLRIRLLRGAAGGGMSLQIPVPLGERRRRHTAVQWILDAANKKQSKGSGRGMFAQRVAEEIVSVAEGKSSVWDKRLILHKQGTSARANLNYVPRKREK